MRDLKDALRPHVPRDTKHAGTFLDFENYVNLEADRFCVEGRDGTWAIRFEAKRASFAMSTVPHREALFVPWRLVHFDAAGVRRELSGFNPFFTKVRNMPIAAREGAATFGYYQIVPQLIAGDFDGSGGEQVIVMSRWARWKRDSGGSGDPEGSEFDLWPTERTLGRAYVFKRGSVQRVAGTEGVWVASAERCPQTGEWVIGTYGRFFRFEEASPREDGELAYPVHGPLFRLYPAAAGGLTMDDPRQMAQLRRACEDASRVCLSLHPPENTAIFEAVCERLPGAPSVRAHAGCANAYEGAQIKRPEGWLERWRQMPVDGVSSASGPASYGDGCECSVLDAAAKSASGDSGARCTTAPRCGRYVVEDPGSGVDESGTGLVHDTATGLRWLRFASPWFERHADAVAYCERRGMRLPTRQEALRVAAGRFCREAWPFSWFTWTSTAGSPSNVWSVLYDGRDWQRPLADQVPGLAALCVR